MLQNEIASIVKNEQLGPRLHCISLQAPFLAQNTQPGQFVHMLIPQRSEHVLRRPFSVYNTYPQEGICEILYQEVGTLTQFLPSLKQGTLELIGPVGNIWSAALEPAFSENDSLADRDFRPHSDASKQSSFSRSNAAIKRALLVGGGVGAAPLYMLAKTLKARGVNLDIILGAQTQGALVCKDRYEALLNKEIACSTDDGSFGRAGFCTSLVEEHLQAAIEMPGKAYDYLAVCGPEPLMKIVASLAKTYDTYCEVSLEKRMACGVGACLSCVVDTTEGKKRCCVDGPIFPSEKLVW